MARIPLRCVLLFLQIAIWCLASPLPTNQTAASQCPWLVRRDTTVLSRRFKLFELMPYKPPSIPAKPLEAIFQIELPVIRSAAELFGDLCGVPGGDYHMFQTTRHVGDASIDIKPVHSNRPVTYGLVRDFLDEVPHMMNQYYQRGFYHQMVFHIYDQLSDSQEVYSAYGTVQGRGFGLVDLTNDTAIFSRSTGVSFV